jgi:hypothetical protein
MLNPGLVGGRESLVYPRLDRLPGSPDCLFCSRGAYPVKSMLITAICGAPGLLTEQGYSFTPILPLNYFLVKLYTGAYGLF